MFYSAQDMLLFILQSCPSPSFGQPMGSEKEDKQCRAKSHSNEDAVVSGIAKAAELTSVYREHTRGNGFPITRPRKKKNSYGVLVVTDYFNFTVISQIREPFPKERVVTGWAVVAHAFTPSTREAKAGGAL